MKIIPFHTVQRDSQEGLSVENVKACHRCYWPGQVCEEEVHLKGKIQFILKLLKFGNSYRKTLI